MAVRININRAPLRDDTTFVNMVFEFGMNSTTNDKRRIYILAKKRFNISDKNEIVHREAFHFLIVHDLQLCVHNSSVLSYDFSSIFNPIFEASIIKSEIFISQYLETSISHLNSPAGSSDSEG